MYGLISVFPVLQGSAGTHVRPVEVDNYIIVQLPTWNIPIKSY